MTVYISFVTHNTEPVFAEVVIHPENSSRTDIGMPIFLTCVGYGVPLPALTWKYNEAVVQNSSQFFINEYTVTESQSTATFLVSSLKVVCVCVCVWSENP